MKIGIIIIFSNNAARINVEMISKSLKPSGDLVLCLVDNQSKDRTLEKLKEIREKLINVEIVEIKKQSSLESAKRAGARFMYNNYDLRHIGFIDANCVKSNNINEVIELVCNSKNAIIELKKELKQQPTRYTLFKSIFSVLDFLKYNDSKKSNDNTCLSST
ncbi:glycosyltransferase family A protein [uncultured Winogradskyella sp.]|uniref:glycosyltransferase family A protein n=1 Tax=uncultured Winogradskyella sp. TaxID=395353 RepID=UPI002637B03D|nr:glycosyltransferase family A protein [uncultured Winogradskyella sp.]